MSGTLPLPIFVGLLDNRRSEQFIGRLILILTFAVVVARDFLEDEAIFPASLWLQLVEKPLDGAFGLFEQLCLEVLGIEFPRLLLLRFLPIGKALIILSTAQ